MAFDARMDGEDVAGNPVPHIIAGVLVLILAAARVIIRLTRGAPPHPEGQPAFLALSAERNTLRLPPYSRLDVRADRAFTWSSRRLVAFVDIANVLNQQNVRNTSYAVDGAGRVLGRPGSLLPFVPSGGLVVEF